MAARANLLQASLDNHRTDFLRHLDPRALDTLDPGDLEGCIAQVEHARKIAPKPPRKTWWRRALARKGGSGARPR